MQTNGHLGTEQGPVGKWTRGGCATSPEEKEDVQRCIISVSAVGTKPGFEAIFTRGISNVILQNPGANKFTHFSL